MEQNDPWDYLGNNGENRLSHQLPQSKMKYIQLNKRIEKMVDEYIYIPHLEYLLAYNKTYLSNIFFYYFLINT